MRRALGKGEKWDRIWDVAFDGEGLGRVEFGAILGERLWERESLAAMVESPGVSGPVDEVGNRSGGVGVWLFEFWGQC